ncbi:hypothetical protein JR316_0005598 [Psilocybe cubensis]|uniref:Uncharacterized protein n=2 Tax=Psilocybe cubensis TaxID=181762 RepID=A0ACB8H050_PSICU|nr:hypothetical protein JR316_0005598 [Psilocybe cubensis]KAH9481079.1 hypothetical protein JR316_0005598 [Psilocybe cubensis]
MNVNQLNYVADLCEAALYGESLNFSHFGQKINMKLEGALSLLILVVIWILLTAKKLARIMQVMFGASILMWIVSTLHLAALIQRLSLGRTELWEAKAAVSLATLQFMISDVILIWRVYAVWGRSYWTTIIPFILMIGAAAVRFSVVSNGTAVLLFVSDPANFIIIANTAYCTALIAGRIMQVTFTDAIKILDSSALGPRGKQNVYERVLLMIIESGALYALSMMVCIVVDKVHSPGIHVILDITVPLTGILPTLIVLVVHYELVPGTRDSISSVIGDSEFHAASGPTATTLGIDASSSRDDVGSKIAASTLKMERSEDDIGDKYNKSMV